MGLAETDDLFLKSVKSTTAVSFFKGISSPNFSSRKSAPHLRRILISRTAFFSFLHQGFLRQGVFHTVGFQRRFSSQGSLLTGNTDRDGTFSKRKTQDDIVSRNVIDLFPKSSLYPYVMLWLERASSLRRRQQGYSANMFYLMMPCTCAMSFGFSFPLKRLKMRALTSMAF